MTTDDNTIEVKVHVFPEKGSREVEMVVVTSTTTTTTTTLSLKNPKLTSTSPKKQQRQHISFSDVVEVKWEKEEMVKPAREYRMEGMFALMDAIRWRDTLKAKGTALTPMLINKMAKGNVAIHENTQIKSAIGIPSPIIAEEDANQSKLPRPFSAFFQKQCIHFSTPAMNDMEEEDWDDEEEEEDSDDDEEDKDDDEEGGCSYYHYTEMEEDDGVLFVSGLCIECEDSDIEDDTSTPCQIQFDSEIMMLLREVENTRNNANNLVNDSRDCAAMKQDECQLVGTSFQWNISCE
eukprot:m.25797 g.25797  ORF g.25797 m.25797 type:complete len:292 (+) comp9209_c0_seq1:456-1331(+)